MGFRRAISAFMCIRGSFIVTLLGKDYLIGYHSCIYRQTSPQGGLDAVRKRGGAVLGKAALFFSYLLQGPKLADLLSILPKSGSADGSA
jgi:hypothetical protein